MGSKRMMVIVMVMAKKTNSEQQFKRQNPEKIFPTLFPRCYNINVGNKS